MRRHPVILGFLLLLCIAAVFIFLAYTIGALSGKRQVFTLNDKVGVVTVQGVMTDAREIVSQLNDFAKDDSIRAVVLRIESPGGAVAPAEEIYGAVRELRKKKPVVSSMGSIAASGGYLVACATNRIVANSGTITGSISAIIHYANAEVLLKKIGIQSSAIKSGKYKDMGSPARGLTPEEKVLLQSVVDDIYDYLLDVISRDRKIKVEELRKIADGRIFTGRQAQKLGLVDELGDMEYALNLAGKLAGLKGRPEAVYPAKKKTSLWEMALQNAASAVIAEWKDRGPGVMGLYFIWNPTTNSN